MSNVYSPISRKSCSRAARPLIGRSRAIVDASVFAASLPSGATFSTSDCADSALSATIFDASNCVGSSPSCPCGCSFQFFCCRKRRCCRLCQLLGPGLGSPPSTRLGLTSAVCAGCCVVPLIVGVPNEKRTSKGSPIFGGKWAKSSCEIPR